MIVAFSSLVSFKDQLTDRQMLLLDLNDVAAENAKSIIDNIYTRQVERPNEGNIGSQKEPILQAGITCTNAFGRLPTMKRLASHHYHA